jgi:hypothetical protein
MLDFETPRLGIKRMKFGVQNQREKKHWSLVLGEWSFVIFLDQVEGDAVRACLHPRRIEQNRSRQILANQSK